MSSRSNRFVSLSAIALLAGCHSAPVQPARTPAPAAQVSLPQSKPAASSGAPDSAATANATSAANAAAAADSTPIPARAAQQYSQALQIMKSGRNTDAELEFKQLSVAYPQFAGPQLNLGLLYMQDSRLPEAEAAFKAALNRQPGQCGGRQ